MAMNRKDEMDRNKTNTPQSNTLSTPPNTTSRGNMGQTEKDPVNRDREMNRDTEVGQGSSGSGQSGRDTFGSTEHNRGTGPDTSKDRGRGPSDISE